jgi:hypothetical protein
MAANFVLLDASLPDVARLLAAMVQTRDAVERRSWSHPQEPTSHEWWADVLADQAGSLEVINITNRKRADRRYVSKKRHSANS